MCVSVRQAYLALGKAPEEHNVVNRQQVMQILQLDEENENKQTGGIQQR